MSRDYTEDIFGDYDYDGDGIGSGGAGGSSGAILGIGDWSDVTGPITSGGRSGAISGGTVQNPVIPVPVDGAGDSSDTTPFKRKGGIYSALSSIMLPVGSVSGTPVSAGMFDDPAAAITSATSCTGSSNYGTTATPYTAPATPAGLMEHPAMMWIILLAIGYYLFLRK